MFSAAAPIESAVSAADIARSEHNILQWMQYLPADCVKNHDQNGLGHHDLARPRPAYAHRPSASAISGSAIPRPSARDFGPVLWLDTAPHRHRPAAGRRPPSSPFRGGPAPNAATPTDTVKLRSICAVRAKGVEAMTSRMRSASVAASADVASGNRMANSSPPKRAAVSMLRI